MTADGEGYGAIINKLNITPQIDSHNNKVTFNVHVNAKGNITLLICNETFTAIWFQTF